MGSVYQRGSVWWLKYRDRVSDRLIYRRYAIVDEAMLREGAAKLAHAEQAAQTQKA
jgi:hypothetical protein